MFSLSYVCVILGTVCISARNQSKVNLFLCDICFDSKYACTKIVKDSHICRYPKHKHHWYLRLVYDKAKHISLTVYFSFVVRVDYVQLSIDMDAFAI